MNAGVVVLDAVVLFRVKVQAEVLVDGAAVVGLLAGVPTPVVRRGANENAEKVVSDLYHDTSAVLQRKVASRSGKGLVAVDCGRVEASA